MPRKTSDDEAGGGTPSSSSPPAAAVAAAGRPLGTAAAIGFGLPPEQDRDEAEEDVGMGRRDQCEEVRGIWLEDRRGVVV